MESFKCPAKKFQCILVTGMDISQVCVTRNHCPLSSEHPKHISYKLNKCMHKKTLYAASQKI